ncbi:MAG TPA: Fe-S cluster assembly protein HesB [Methanoregulaceae archaeon]|nr:Fe-S cluster assembly protein HesB [Methanoregulaceae archaeon]
MSESSSDKISRILSRLFSLYGQAEWWEADSPEEVMIGAILTQQTRWENASRAIDRLKAHDICTFGQIYTANTAFIEELIRPSGYFRQKTKRLKDLAEFILQQDKGIESLAKMETAKLRKELLSVKGIGEETADSILAYGFSRESLVIDAYTRRIFTCAEIGEEGDDLRRVLERAVPESSPERRQAHAHLVEYAKEFCNHKRCEECVIRNLQE